MSKQTSNKFSPEVRSRAVRLVLHHEHEHASQWAAIVSVSSKIGCTTQTPNEWIKKSEVDSGKRSGVPTEVGELLKALERENRELRQAAVEVEFSGEGITVARPWSLSPTTRRKEILAPEGSSTSGGPIRSEARARLVEGIARGRLWMRELVSGAMIDTKQIARREGCSDRFVRMALTLAFLDPRLVKAAVSGQLPRSAGSSTFFDASANWSEH